jgi:hypothetical protein
VDRLLPVAAYRLAGFDDPPAHGADDLRALNVLDATIRAEHDILAGLEAYSAQDAMR